MNLADVLLERETGSGAVLRDGIVAAISPLTVIVPPSTVASPVAKLDSCNPGVGDFVQVLVQGANRLVIGVVAGGVLTDWTPALQQGVGVTISDNYSRYRKTGRHYECWFHITATSAGSATNAIQIGGLPANPAFASFNEVGTAHFTDVSDGNRVYPAHLVFVTSTATLQLWSTDITGGDLGIKAVAVASGDVVTGHFSYEGTS